MCANSFKNSTLCRLRALSSGGSVTSPPPSPAMPKYKLAEYRYGREEMLALYIKDNKVGIAVFHGAIMDELLGCFWGHGFAF